MDDDIHRLVYLVDREATMYLLHCGTGVFHGVESLFVDVCGYDGVDFALQSHYLAACLFKGVFELLLAPKGRFGGYPGREGQFLVLQQLYSTASHE